MASSVATADPDTADDEPVVDILTHGDPIRSFLAAARAMDDEAKFHITDDGISLNYVDVANVCMVDLEAPAEGFERFDVSRDITVGMNMKTLAGAVSNARKGRSDDGDPVTIEVFEDPTRIRVGVTRPDRSMKMYREWFGIDPNSLREQPNVPDLDLPNRADPDPKALKAGVNNLDHHHDHGLVARDGDRFVLASRAGFDVSLDDDNPVGDSVYYNGTAWGTGDGDEDGHSILSLDYLKDFADALVNSKADRCTISFGEEFPVIIDFEHEDWGFDGTFLQAPRIPGDDS